MQVLQVFEGGYTDIQAGMGKSQNNVLHSSQGCGGGSGGAGVSVSVSRVLFRQMWNITKLFKVGHAKKDKPISTMIEHDRIMRQQNKFVIPVCKYDNLSSISE